MKSITMRTHTSRLQDRWVAEDGSLRMTTMDGRTIQVAAEDAAQAVSLWGGTYFQYRIVGGRKRVYVAPYRQDDA